MRELAQLTEPVWVYLAAVFQFHELSIAELAVRGGIRDREAIESKTLDRRPKNLFCVRRS